MSDKMELVIWTQVDFGQSSDRRRAGVVATASRLVGGDREWVSDAAVNADGTTLVAGSTADFDTRRGIGARSLGLDGYIVRTGRDLDIESVTFIAERIPMRLRRSGPSRLAGFILRGIPTPIGCRSRRAGKACDQADLTGSSAKCLQMRGPS
jgi:hypothetical protein